MLRERVRPTLLGIGLIALSVALVAGGIAAPATAATSPATAVAKILADTNALRAANGKAPLVENPAIESVAQSWAAQMGAAGSMSHNPDYSTQMPANWSRVAENVATGYTYDRVVPDGWATSPDHLTNMLGDYTDIGIGYWESPTGVTYFVQDFGAYTSTPAAASATPAPSSTPSPSATPSAAAVAAQSGASMPNLATLPWWGGPAYYAKFSKAAASGWTSPSFFPIAVFYGKPSHASALKAAGINTYMGAEHDGSPMSMITQTGMSVLAQDEWSTAEVGNDPRVVGYHVSDECEMGSGACPGTTETARLAEQQQLASAMRKNDGRFLQANFGNGVLGTYWAPNTMSQFVSSVDVTSVDKYAYTSPAVDGVIQQSSYWPTGKNPATSRAYGWQQDRMASYSGSATPNWVFVETAKPFLTESGSRTIAPDQIEGAVWNAIIHGAAGISYFQHNNNGTCGTYSILQCGATLTAKITAIDAQVQSLAPVINTQSYAWSFGTGLDTSLKVTDGSAYVFAMTDGSTGSKKFTLPAGLASTVQVVGENRTITVAGDGTFSDSFANEYTHHIYKVALTGAPPTTGNQAPPTGGSSTTAPPVTTTPPPVTMPPPAPYDGYGRLTARASGSLVNSLYQDVLGRSPDSGGKSYWTGAIQNGLPVSYAVNGVLASTEYYSGRIDAAYVGALGRHSDASGLGYWLSQISSGYLPVDQVKMTLTGSDEFYYMRAGGDPVRFVYVLYQTLLNRNPGADEAQYWSWAVTQYGRAFVIASIYNSAESAARRIDALYGTYFQRHADAGGTAYWTPIVIAQGDQALRGILVNSPEYVLSAVSRYPNG